MRNKELSPAVVAVILIVVVAAVAFWYYRGTVRVGRTPPPGMRPRATAPGAPGGGAGAPMPMPQSPPAGQ